MHRGSSLNLLRYSKGLVIKESEDRNFKKLKTYLRSRWWAPPFTRTATSVGETSCRTLRPMVYGALIYDSLHNCRFHWTKAKLMVTKHSYTCLMMIQTYPSWSPWIQVTIGENNIWCWWYVCKEGQNDYHISRYIWLRAWRGWLASWKELRGRASQMQ